jgi:uncharacterized repeat protein (TIGR02543 family)
MKLQKRPIVLLTVACLAGAAAVYADFVLAVYKAGDGAGTVTATPTGSNKVHISCGTGAACEDTYRHNTSVTLTARPASGSAFVSWDNKCSCPGGCADGTTSASCTVTVCTSCSVTATFAKLFPLTITKSGTGSGTISSRPSGIACGSTCTKTFRSGDDVVLSVAILGGSSFTGWTGACSGTAATCTVTMAGAQTVGASFKQVFQQQP